MSFHAMEDETVELSLWEKQTLLMRLLPRLLDRAHELGYQVTGGDLYRDPRVFGAAGDKQGYGASYSLHKERLAVDLNLFRDGRYLTTSEQHRPLGEFWEALHPLTCWGGRFNDGNHYSIAHDGRK